MTVGESARRPTKVGSRDRKVARDPGLCVGMSAGMVRIATMVKELTDSTLEERLLHCRWLRRRQPRSFRQVVVMKEFDVETCDRCCGSAARTQCPGVVSAEKRLGRVRIE